MTLARIANFKDHVGGEVTVQGWLHNKRSSGKLQFLILRDGSGFAQAVVAKAAVAAEAWEAADKAGQESSLEVTGKVREDKRAPGGYEMDVSGLQVLQAVHDYPITPKDHGPAFLLEHRHLWLRSPRQHAAIRVRHAVVKATRDFLDDQGFTLVDTPIFTPAACEGTTTLFEVPYFEEGLAYLTQSGQLYNEATAAAHGKVYCFGPTFRAEKSKTRRHLTEFWMVEPEVAFARLDDAIALAEGLVCRVVEVALERCKAELQTLERDTKKLEAVKAPFPRMHYEDAMKLLQEKGSETKMGSDFGGTDETIIASAHERPVVVHRFPSAIKAFYMAPDPDRPEFSLSMDVLAPEGYGEIVGGGERLADLDLLQKRIAEHNLPAESFQWYLDLRRFGTFPHAGFGMGIERVVTWICGLEHLRETSAFPRMLYRIYP
ncbi:MAG TPA: asparagine--tRNA ligase [Vicinamibacteria bacterium]